MYHGVKLIKEAIVGKGFPRDAIQEREGKNSAVIFSLPLESASMQSVQFFNSDDDNDVAIRLYTLISGVPKSKRAAMLEAINECNTKYRYVKFVLDSDGDVNVEYDIAIETSDECLGEVAFEIGIVRMHDILKDAYPILMRAMWA